MTTVKRFSFWNGWCRVPKINQDALKADIMNGLGINSDIAFIQRRQGKVIPKVTEKESIESAFKKYGVAADKVWGGSSHCPIN